jgi:hypothetical protein
MAPEEELFADCYEWAMKWQLELILDEGFFAHHARRRLAECS